MEKIKIFFIFLFLFLLDFLKPLGYSLYVHFLLLGILFFSSKFSPFSLCIGLLFSFFEDILSFSFPFYTLLFSLISLGIRYFLNYFTLKSVSKFFVVGFSITFYILVHIFMGKGNISFNSYSIFFLHSFLFFFLLDKFISEWIQKVS
ncbi:MAG: hypothetical protein B6D56_03030 [Candidatus Omnitrophica bacterium 4484_70.1]|nr:MAG: hypothetical protein B6D56_03030 [Candidatus Omnitrophica bacterium 4484_70.1]